MNAISSEVGRGLLYILDAEPARAGVGVSLRVAFVGVAAAGEVPNAAMMRLAMLAIEGAAVTEGVLMWSSGLISTSTWNGDSLGGPPWKSLRGQTRKISRGLQSTSSTGVQRVRDSINDENVCTNGNSVAGTSRLSSWWER